MPPLDMIPAPGLLRIYYADLFNIEGSGVLIMGSGKTQCGIAASMGEDAAMLGQDFICLSTQAGRLHGHKEWFMVPKRHDPEPMRIDVLAYCMSEQQTIDIFYGETPRLKLATPDNILRAGDLNIRRLDNDSVNLMRNHISIDLLAMFADGDRRLDRFAELIKSDPNLRCIFLPWMPTVEDKAQMLRDAI